jgi:hypothetical protein
VKLVGPEKVEGGKYSREALDAMAKNAGLDPDDYANKGELANAINEANAAKE